MTTELPPDRLGQSVSDVRLAGHLFQIQNVTGNVTVNVGPIVRSAYLEQVKRIAPPELYDRGDELLELTEFCTDVDRPPYTWWRAEAWSGKSALMSWFVLHPPSDVQIISFFITARYADQNDRVAFIDVVLEQLAELLRQPMPAYLTEATREAHFMNMLNEAASACRQRKQRLVLVVDGLDEDRGVTIGPDAYSIAALLPSQPVAGLRIITAGRSDPPIPADVPEGHPLRDPATVRQLSASRWAEVVKTDMQRELKRLLHGTQTEQDLLGLIASAGGGLSAAALTELTGLGEYEVEENLHAVIGRTFTTRVSLWQPDTAPLVFVLGHEELQMTAIRFLGDARLTDYRQRLHKWADGYRARNWPIGTPEYLFRGYFRMLHATRDIPRLVTCATDRARHERMLDITGGDISALNEITLAHEAVLSLEQPDLEAVALLVVHRIDLTRRNSGIPESLPAAWATLGQQARAEALARGKIDPDEKVGVAIDLAEAVVRAEVSRRVVEIADTAESFARSITEPYGQAVALAYLARALATTGDRERAIVLAAVADELTQDVEDASGQGEIRAILVETLAAAGSLEKALNVAGQISGLHYRARAFAALVRAFTAAGDLGRAEMLIQSLTEPFVEALALAALVEALEAADQHARAIAMTTTAEERILTITEGNQEADARLALVRAIAAGDPDRAEALANSITTNQYKRAQALSSLAQALAAMGDYGRAEELAFSITEPADQVDALSALIQALATVGSHDQASELIVAAEDVINSMIDAYEQTEPLGVLVRAVAAAGDLDRARALAHDITSDPYREGLVLADLVQGLLAAGRTDPANELAAKIETIVRNDICTEQNVKELARLMEVVFSTGDHDRVSKLIVCLESLVDRIIDPEDKMGALVALVRALATIGDLDEAETLAQDITWTTPRAEAFAALVQAAAIAEDNDRIATLGDEALVQANKIIDWLTDPDPVPSTVMDALKAVIVALARASRHGDAEALAHRIPREEQRGQALIDVISVTAGATDSDRITRLATTVQKIAAGMTDPGMRARTLAELAAVLAVSNPGSAAGIAVISETLISDITDTHKQVAAVGSLVKALIALGDCDHAEELIRRVSSPHLPSGPLADVVQTLAAAGEDERAEELIRNIGDPLTQAQALVAFAEFMAAVGEHDRAEELVLGIDNEGWQARGLTALARVGDPARARYFIAQALSLGWWMNSLEVLAKIDPTVVAVITDDRLSIYEAALQH